MNQIEEGFIRVFLKKKMGAFLSKNPKEAKVIQMIAGFLVLGLLSFVGFYPNVVHMFPGWANMTGVFALPNCLGYANFLVPFCFAIGLGQQFKSVDPAHAPEELVKNIEEDLIDKGKINISDKP